MNATDTYITSKFKHRYMIIVNSCAAGGAERVAIGLANHISEKGHEVAINCVTNAGEPAYEIKGTIKFYRGLAPSKSLVAKLATLIRNTYSFKPDYIVCFSSRINVVVPFLPRFKNTRIILTERNDPNIASSRFFRFLRNHAFSSADGAVFQTRDAQEYYAGVLHCDSVVIPNPVRPADKVTPIQDRSREAIMVCRLTEQKNVLMGIKAFWLAARKHPEYSMSIFGVGELHDLIQSFINENGMNHRVVLKGLTKDVFGELDRRRIFILSSDYEGMPNALLEAMSMGCCAVSTDCPIGGPRELIADGKNGFLVPVGDIENTCETIERLMSNTELQKSISQNAIRSMKTYSPQIIYDDWYNYINHI